MKITDLRIGDQVMVGNSTHRVIGLHINGDVEVNAVDESGRYKHYYAVEVELCQPRYKLPEWKKEDGCDSIASTSVKHECLNITYEIDKYDDEKFTLLFFRNVHGTIRFKAIDKYQTLENAKDAAEKHYNELVSEVIEGLETLLNNKTMVEK